LAYAKGYDYARAREFYERAIAVQLDHPAAFQGMSKVPPSHGAYWNLSWIDLDLGDVEGQQRDLERLVQLDREFDSPWRVAQEIHLAYVHYLTGDMEGCVEAFAPNIEALEASVHADRPMTHWGLDYDRHLLCSFYLARAKLAEDSGVRESGRPCNRSGNEASFRCTYVLALAEKLDEAIDANQRTFLPS
jgi:tetratricopeptide (TPR) repeat protein